MYSVNVLKKPLVKANDFFNLFASVQQYIFFFNYIAVYPPSTGIIVPVTYDDRSEANHNEAWEISSAFANLPNMLICLAYAFGSKLNCFNAALNIGVSIAPGAIALILILSFA